MPRVNSQLRLFLLQGLELTPQISLSHKADRIARHWLQAVAEGLQLHVQLADELQHALTVQQASPADPVHKIRANQGAQRM